MGFGSKCSIKNGQVIYIQKAKLNIADMWLIPLDRVTYVPRGNLLLVVIKSSVQNLSFFTIFKKLKNLSRVGK